MKTIELTKGASTMVDEDDYFYLSQFNWYCDSSGYARRKVLGKTVLMHRVIVQPPEGLVVDHINHNRLDNRKENLRAVTQAENMRNRKDRPRPHNNGYSLGLGGYSYQKDIGKWRSYLSYGGTQIFFSYFSSKIAAEEARDSAAMYLTEIKESNHV